MKMLVHKNSRVITAIGGNVDKIPGQYCIRKSGLDNYPKYQSSYNLEEHDVKPKDLPELPPKKCVGKYCWDPVQGFYDNPKHIKSI